ncbi:hypothetical protein EBU71_10230 [bacterium]|nr:hypothetical protein [Candidatus Elulimicrobium humile]
MVGKFLISLFFSLCIGGILSLKAQSFTYTYINPCNGRSQSVQLSTQSSQVTMFFAGQARNFTYAELESGAYEQWVQAIRNSLPPGANPCASEGARESTNITNFIGSVTANNISSLTSVVSMASSIGNSIGGVGSGTPGGSEGGSSQNSNTGSGGQNSGSDNNNNSSSGSSGSGNNNSSGGSGGSSGSNSSGSSSGSSGSSGSNQRSGSNPKDGSSNQDSESGETTAIGEQNQQVSSGGESGNQEGSSGKSSRGSSKVSNGALIATGDIVVIRNDSDITKTGNDNFRFNTSLTHVNTEQTFIKGININYQTGQNILNLSGYGSLKVKNYMGIFSTSYMTNFREDWFFTGSLLNAQKIDKVTLMAGTTFTTGKLADQDFRNWALMAGGFTNFKGGRSLGVNFLGLGVYSPYTYYYAGQWYQSGLLIIPMINTDMKVTSKFKWTVSFSGVYQLNQSFLNWQVLTGTKILL